MQISLNDWIKYKNKLASISEKAADEMVQWLQTKGGYQNVSRTELIDYAYALSTKYGEASASLSALMYDETADKSGVTVPSAEVADTATYGETAKAVNGATKKLTTDNQVGSVVSRLVKQAGADTTLKNAKRDSAQFAWVPAGDTCAFCLALAANGWQYASKEGNHADHIHPHCDCTYAVRFDNKSTVKGYDPEKYKKIFENAEGDTWEEKINSVRRMQYQENKDKINAQKRMNYAAKNNKNIFPIKNGNGKITLNQLSVSVSEGTTKTIREVLGEISVDRIDEAISFFSDEIRSNTVEHAIVIEKSGKVVHFIGDEKGVLLYDVDLNGAHVLHNHPSSNGYTSFGEDDFTTIRDNPSCIFDLCNDMYDYHLEVINDMSALTYNLATHMVKGSMFEVSTSGEDYQHVIMEGLMDKGYIKYERRKK